MNIHTSPPYFSTSSSPSPSSSSSLSSTPPHHQSATKPKTKRTRRSPNLAKHHPGISAGRRSSIYRGVTRHRWTGRYEAHLWDKNSWNPVQNKKGRQVYLGAYDDEEAAAHTYDLAALKYWGPDTILNFPLSTYQKEYEEMQNVSKEEYLASLRRRSSGFSRGVSKYRGVARHHHNGRWEARIGRVYGNKYLYLGTYSTQEEAATAYDMAAIEYRGRNAVTNFDMSRYLKQKQLLLQQQQHHQPLAPQQGPQAPPTHQPNEGAQAQPDIHFPQSQNLGPIDQSPMVDPLIDQSWNLSTLDPTFTSLPLPNFSPERSSDLQYFFSGLEFEDNIEFLFDTSYDSGGRSNGCGNSSEPMRNNELSQGSGASMGNGIFDNSGEFQGNFDIGGIENGDFGLLMEESLTSSVDSISYPFPISICS